MEFSLDFFLNSVICLKPHARYPVVIKPARRRPWHPPPRPRAAPPSSRPSTRPAPASAASSSPASPSSRTSSATPTPTPPPRSLPTASPSTRRDRRLGRARHRRGPCRDGPALRGARPRRRYAGGGVVPRGESDGLPLYYPVCPEPESTMGIVPHTDPVVLTILAQDDVGGLQVKHTNENGESYWVDAKPVPGALMINVGDLLQMMSIISTRAWNTG